MMAKTVLEASNSWSSRKMATYISFTKLIKKKKSIESKSKKIVIVAQDSIRISQLSTVIPRIKREGINKSILNK